MYLMNFFMSLMMNKEGTSWYETITYSDDMVLEQGDILFGCPYYDTTGEEVNGVINAKIVDHNVVIMTQSCDIANKKVDKIFVAPWEYISAVIRKKEEADGELNTKKKKSFFKHLSEGVMPNFHLLDEDKEKGLDDYLVIDFSNTFTISPGTMMATAAKQGSVIRLKSPYKEHLSQAFARFFMRVGLPSNLVNPF